MIERRCLLSHEASGILFNPTIKGYPYFPKGMGCLRSMGPPTPHVLSDTCGGGYLITTGMTVQFSLLELAFSPHSYL